MHRLSAYKSKIYMVTALIALSFCGIGIGYAMWSGSLVTVTGLTTGTINMVFDPMGDFSVSVVEMDGTLIEELAQGYDITERTGLMSRAEKHAQLMVPGDLLLEKLAQPDKMLRLQYDICPADGSTIETIHPRKANFRKPAQELVIFQPADPVMVVDGKEYDLPADLAELLPALKWECYSELDQVGSQITVSIYLRLTPESMEALTLPEEIVLTQEDLPEEVLFGITPDEQTGEGELQVKLQVNYSFCLPVLLEQGR